MELRAIIVEDEVDGREILRRYIEKYCPEVSLKGEASNIDEALVLIRNNSLDLVFLDVEMPFGNAFDLLDKIPDRNFEIIFVTAYNHYALEALNNHAAYYLMKPIAIDELIKAVDHVKEVKEKENRLQEKILIPNANGVSGKITVPQLDGFEILEASDILYCKADDNYTEIYLENKKLVASKTLKYFEQALEKFSFLRIHKSYLVNITAIVKYKKGKGGSVVLKTGKELLVSSSKKKALLSYFE